MKTSSRFLFVIGLSIFLSAILFSSNRIFHSKKLIKSPESGQTSQSAGEIAKKVDSSEVRETSTPSETPSQSSEAALGSASKASRETTAIAETRSTDPEQVLRAAEVEGIRSRLSLGGNGSDGSQSVLPFRSLG